MERQGPFYRTTELGIGLERKQRQRKGRVSSSINPHNYQITKQLLHIQKVDLTYLACIELHPAVGFGGPRRPSW